MCALFVFRHLPKAFVKYIMVIEALLNQSYTGKIILIVLSDGNNRSGYWLYLHTILEWKYWNVAEQ